MDYSKFITPKHRELLKQARDTYGEPAQMLVSIEELCELICVCAKFLRFKNSDTARSKLHDQAVDEVADTLVVLDHIMNIFDLTPVDIGDRTDAKMARMSRWLQESTSQEQTMIDRKVETHHQTSLFDKE